MAEKKPRKRSMTDDHKAALAAGRTEGRAVRRYLEAVEAHKPKRGRKRTPESIEKRLRTIEDQLATADPLNRVNLIQERMDLTTELEGMQEKVDMTELEQEFVKAALGYSERRGISYAAWREAGVSASVLTQAGITRSM